MSKKERWKMLGRKEELMRDLFLKQLGEVGTETSKHLKERRIGSLLKQGRRKLMILNTNSLGDGGQW